MNIMLTCAGRRNYLVEFFKSALKNSGNIIAVDMEITAPALAIADKAFVVPGIYDPEYIKIILDLCQKEGVAAILSLNDLELPVLSKSRKQFEDIGVKLVLSSDKIVDTCFDKWKTIEFINSLGINTAKTYLTKDDAVVSIDKGELKFPLVIKPRWGSASIGIEYPENLKELELAYDLVKLKLRRTILSEVSKTDNDHSIIIQEKIKGTEYGIDVLNNFNGHPVQVYVKEKLSMRAGETDKAVLRDKPDLNTMGFVIGEALGHIGNLDCDVFESNGKYYLLELNPRFGGGYPFSHMAGADYPGAILSWLKDVEYNFDNFTYNYDQVYSKCDTLIKVKTSL